MVRIGVRVRIRIRVRVRVRVRVLGLRFGLGLLHLSPSEILVYKWERILVKNKERSNTPDLWGGLRVG